MLLFKHSVHPWRMLLFIADHCRVSWFVGHGQVLPANPICPFSRFVGSFALLFLFLAQMNDK